MNKLRVFEAFAGIGSQRKALELVKKDKYEVVGLAEWNVPAIIMYEAIHNKLSLDKLIDVDKETAVLYLNSKPLSIDSKNLLSNKYWNKKNVEFLKLAYTAVKRSEEHNNIFDVKKLHERTLKGVDLLTYSFPCQDLSIQGNQKGMGKNLGTRSGLLWEIEKALEATKKQELPKYLLMENVTAVFYKNNRVDFNQWLNKLEQLGYKNSYGKLNAADFGSPQARNRAFMISSLGKNIDLPIGGCEGRKALKTILDDTADYKNMLPKLDNYEKTEFKVTDSNIKRCSLLNYTTFTSENYVYDINYTGPTLTASGANSRIKFLDNNRIRKINSREAFKYMGFTEADYEKVNDLNLLTETQKIFAAGNSISVEVLKEIMKGLD